MRVILYSSLLPNPFSPCRGTFLWELYEAQSHLTDIVPVAPIGLRHFRVGLANSDYAKFKGYPICFPPFFYFPKIFKSLDCYFMAIQSFPVIKRLITHNTIIHAHYLYPDACAASILGKWFKVPVIVTGHGSDLNILPDNKKIKERIRQTLKTCNIATAVSKALTDKILDIAGEINCQIIPNGFNPEIFYPQQKNVLRNRYGFSRDEIILLAVGRLIPLKRFDMLIEIFARLKLKKKRLVIVGDGPMLAHLKKLIVQLKLHNQVLLTGQLDRKDVSKFMALSDMLCIPSSSEGWPTVIFESLACGTPVVGTPVGGIPEALYKEYYGQVARGLSATSFSDAIYRLLQRTPDKLVTERVRYASNYSWRKIAQKYLALYRDLMDQNF